MNPDGSLSKIQHLGLFKSGINCYIVMLSLKPRLFQIFLPSPLVMDVLSGDPLATENVRLEHSPSNFFGSSISVLRSSNESAANSVESSLL